MRIPAASSNAIRAVTAGRPQAAHWLEAGDAALYFATTQRLATTQQSPTVFAVLSHDSVRLPCGPVLATTTAERKLTSIAAVREVHSREDAVVGDGRVEWTGPDGRVTVVAARHWSPLAGGDSPPPELALFETKHRSGPRDPHELGARHGEPPAGLGVGVGNSRIRGDRGEHAPPVDQPLERRFA